MKTIKLDKRTAKGYLTELPEKTHTKEEMDSLLRAIRFTHMFKQEESLAKMDEEELMVRPLPKLS
jgi:intergrase/recombinase